MRKAHNIPQAKYESILSQLTAETGWSQKTAGAVLTLLLAASERKDNRAQLQEDEAKRRYYSTRKLLKNYHQLAAAVSSGISRAIDVLDDTEIQRLMEREESVQNQQVRSLALQKASNKILFLRLNAALDEMKTICQNDPNPRFRRQYDLIYSRYVHKLATDEILELFSIERTEYFRNIKMAIETLSLLLFGPINPGGFAVTEAENSGEDTLSSPSEEAV